MRCGLTTDNAQPDRPSFLTSVVALLAASAAFVALGIITSHQGGDGYLSGAPSVVTLLAAFCVLFPDTRSFGQLLTWNTFGLALTSLAFGLFTVGALAVLPLMLVLLALVTWPNSPGQSSISPPTIGAFLGGCLVVLVIAYLSSQQVGG